MLDALALLSLIKGRQKTVPFSITQKTKARRFAEIYGLLKYGVPTGIRTPVPTVKGSCPRPLDDRDLYFGGGKRDRTADLLHAMQALSQLSYTPKIARQNARGNILPEKNCGVPTGIRTPVPTVKGSCPRPLDDRDPDCLGGGKRDRTADLLHAMQALSQLSYTPDNRET